MANIINTNCINLSMSYIEIKKIKKFILNVFNWGYGRTPV